MVTHTAGPWRQGRLLMTASVRRWSPELIEQSDRDERCRVFANFTERDEGRSREFVASCGNEQDARLIAASPGLLALVHQYRDDLRHPPTADSITRRLAAIDAVLAKVGGGA